MTTKNLRYNLETINDIIFQGFDYSLPEKTMKIISEIALQVGAPDYVRTPVFQKRENPLKSEQQIARSNWKKLFPFATKFKRRLVLIADTHLRYSPRHWSKAPTQIGSSQALGGQLTPPGSPSRGAGWAVPRVEDGACGGSSSAGCGSSSPPSHLAMTTLATVLPTTFVAVRPISRK